MRVERALAEAKLTLVVAELVGGDAQLGVLDPGVELALLELGHMQLVLGTEGIASQVRRDRAGISCHRVGKRKRRSTSSWTCK